MRNYYQDKILLMRSNEKKRITRNALRGAAKPWDLMKARSVFIYIDDPREKLRVFHEHIGNIFPLILDLSVDGLGIATIERQMGLTNRMLWQWLKIRPALMAKVLEARGLRRSEVDRG